MSEFQITTLKTGEIIFDVEEAKQRITERVSGLENMVVTEDAIKEAKELRATLNKERTAFDSERKAVKKKFEEPLKTFESKVKEVLSIYDKAIENIDKQTKAFEEKRIAEKQAHLRELYEESIGEYKDFLPFEAVKTPQWDNATYTDKDVQFDISSARTKIITDLEAIRALRSEFEDDVIQAYKRSGNQLSEAIKRNSDLISAKQRAEQRAKEEAERKAREEAERAEEARKAEEARLAEEAKEEPVDDDLPFPGVMPVDDDLPFPEDMPVEEEATFVIHGDIDKAEKILREAGIKFEVYR